MQIYVGHSSSLDFRSELYQPIRDSRLDETRTFVLPHEDSDEPFESKPFLRGECDLVIAEVQSHRQVSELSWGGQICSMFL